GSSPLKPISSSLQAPRPAAWEGLTESPAGKVIVASRSGAAPRASGAVSWGCSRGKSRPAGESGGLGLGLASVLGSKGSAPQPSRETGSPARLALSYSVPYWESAGSGCSQVSARTPNSSGVPGQSAGIVRKAALAGSVGHSPPPVLHTSRTYLW